MVLTPPDVKVCAEELGIPVYQPVSFKSEEPLEIIKKYNPDVIVVAAYGKLLPKAVLESAKHGCINIHGSLLPKYRGAAPIQQAVLNGAAAISPTGFDWLGLILISFVLPAILCPIINHFCRKAGWVKDGDLTLE